MATRQSKMLEASVPRVVSFEVKNYRALKQVEMKDLTPLTVLIGRNGSGKSTLFDVFAFLSECFTEGLRRAWDRRGRFKELRTRGEEGPIVFELKYREKPGEPLITYHLAIQEENRFPYVAEEWLQWRRKSRGRPFRFLDFKNGEGKVFSGEQPDEKEQRIDEKLESPELLAVNTLGQFAKHPRVSVLRRFITSWYLSYLSIDSTRATPESGIQERLSRTGDNLPNVIQYLKEQHSERLDKILRTLSERVPQLERVDASTLADGRLLLQVKDAPFEEPVLAKFASDGTLKLLAYLTVLYDPDPPQMIGIEEPENHLYPGLLTILAEECRAASEHSQLMVTTHSPYFVDGLSPKEVWILSRDQSGYTRAKRVDSIPGINKFMDAEALLGDLWMEGFFAEKSSKRNPSL